MKEKVREKKKQNINDIKVASTMEIEDKTLTWKRR